MNPEYHAQLQRLHELRQQSQGERKEITGYASVGRYPGGQSQVGVAIPAEPRRYENEPPQDPLIYPGLYAPSGFDILDILVRVHQRPNPTLSIGNVDHSVALTVCDGSAPDTPIVYCTETFQNLTGYSEREIVGRNCRFLQVPPSACDPSQSAQDSSVNGVARRELRDKILKQEEARVQLVNYTKFGRRFTNILTVVPISWQDGKTYFVGFQIDAQQAFT